MDGGRASSQYHAIQLLLLNQTSNLLQGGVETHVLMSCGIDDTRILANITGYLFTGGR